MECLKATRVPPTAAMWRWNKTEKHNKQKKQTDFINNFWTQKNDDNKIMVELSDNTSITYT